ncbi:EF-hand calcium-binding domain-containing protein 1-like isoform X2 [Xenia sp. Carnegie-2017]|uniref:EF-hand calcium-binding domain-containing protein 1-like isoform X2 n=1 Tax=Xenia sp. Carnegie-2017 TaxID=2897299 RepID=UPI001F034A23|nr:EF-hand calcium-binding domain-containing protein 1-like isoform X2 [Xenia sp. Carnegie-2017]
MTSLTVKKNQAKIAEGIYKQTHFTKTEVENLLMIFRERANQKEKLDRTKFRDILHNTFGMTDDFLMDGVFRAFDKDNDSNINMEEWILGLSVFLRDCFEVYDLNSDGYISREEIFQMLKSSLIKQPTEEDPDEGVKELVEIVLKLVDHGNVGKLSFKDFEMVVNKEPLLLEAFGPCLPDAKAIDDFNTQFTDTT